MKLTPEQSKLVESNHNLIYYILERHHLPVDEYYGDAAIALCHAASLFDPSKGKEFASYARTSIENELHMRNRSAKHQIDTVSLDSISSSVGESSGMQEEIENADFLKRFVENAGKILDERQFQVAKMLIGGKNQSEISSKLGVSKQYVNQIVRKIREKLIALKVKES